MMQPPLLCHRCAQVLTSGDGSLYIVRIEAICDPTPPDLEAPLTQSNFAGEWEQLLDSMHELTERELMDQVYRRMTIHLCAGCYRRRIENPTGESS